MKLSQLQAELEQEWKGKCSQMLASAKGQHSREVAELTEQREGLQDKLTQLQEKVHELVLSYRLMMFILRPLALHVKHFELLCHWNVFKKKQLTFK